MSKLLPYETIVKAHEGDPEAVNAVLRHYAGYIRYFSKVNGQVNAEVEDYVKQRLIDCQFNACILDGISTVDHHVVPHINPYMAGSRRIVSPLEEDQVSRFCFCRGNFGTVSHQSVCSLPADVPAVPAVIDHPAYKPGTVKAGRRGTATPHIGIPQVFLRFTDHVSEFLVCQSFRRDLIAKITAASRKGFRIKQIIPVPVCTVIKVITPFLVLVHQFPQYGVQPVVGQRHVQPVHFLCGRHFYFLAAIVIRKIGFPGLVSVGGCGGMVAVIHIKLYPVPGKGSCIFHHILHAVHNDFRSNRHKGIAGIHGNGMVSRRINAACRRAAGPLAAADGTTAVPAGYDLPQRFPHPHHLCLCHCLPCAFRSNTVLISYDTTDFHIEGKEGSWLAYDSIIIDGREFFLMEHTAYGAQAANVVLDSDGSLVADNVFHGFDETVKQQIREYLHLQTEEPSEVKQEKPALENWQKAYENGEYLRSAEITEEQNYNMIDGRMNNLPLKPRKIGERISVLDRLHLKQAEIARKSGKPVPQMAVEEDMERRRK